MNRLTGGYAPLGAPSSSHIIGGPTRDRDLELNALSSSTFYDEVSLLRSSLTSFDSSISALSTRHVQSLASPSDALTAEIDQLQRTLRDDGTGLMKRIEALGATVGRDEGRRGHWDGLKAGLKRSLGRYQQVEMAQRERVKDRVARQYRIVKPEATDEEVKEVLESNQGGQIFMQAVTGSRAEGAQAALSEAKTRREEVQKIEQTLTELAMLFNQVAELVAAQDASIITVEDTTRQVEEDTGYAVKELGIAKVSAAAARHKRKLCAAFAAIIVIVIIVVIIIEVKSSSGGSSSTKTVTTTDSAKTSAVQTSLAATAMVTSAAVATSAV